MIRSAPVDTHGSGRALTAALAGMLGDAGTLAIEFVILGTNELLGRPGAVHATAEGGAGEAQLRASAHESTLGKHGGGDRGN